MHRLSTAHRTCDLILGVGDGKVYIYTLTIVLNEPLSQKQPITIMTLYKPAMIMEGLSLTG